MRTASLAFFAACCIGGTLMTSGCQPNPPQTTQTPALSQVAPTANPATPGGPSPASTPPAFAEKWLGKWTEPEGTYLLLSRTGAGYTVGIRDLDRLQTYPAHIAGDHFEFTRDGKTETLRAGNGKATGMKWLLEKKDCLFVRSGEGFCRD